MRRIPTQLCGGPDARPFTLSHEDTFVYRNPCALAPDLHAGYVGAILDRTHSPGPRAEAFGPGVHSGSAAPMATTTRKKPRMEPATQPGRDTLLGFYRTMLLSRRLDDKEIQLKQQNKIFFQISGAGHEGVQVAAAAHARPGNDWFYFYYRDRAFCLGLGMTALDQMLQAVGAEADIGSGGRQMPSHWGHPALNIVSTSSPTGTQFLQAVGTAEAGIRAEKVGEPLVEITRAAGDEIAWVTTGDGTTSEGEFWESLNTACNLKLPVLYIVEDNEFAISVPVEVNTAGGSISKLVAGFPGLLIETCDGTDVVESYEVLGRAVEYCRQRKGPALVHAM